MNRAVIGVVLAGGLARRMGGGDKALIRIAGRPILEHAIARLRPQVEAIMLNANGDPARFASFGLPVESDPVAGFVGPLAGVLAGLEWARREHRAARWVASIAGDTPFLPRDLVARLHTAIDREAAEMACAASAGRRHPVIGLWPVGEAGALRRALVEEGVRKVDVWTARYRLAVAEFDARPYDPFFNANRPEDVTEAERMVMELGA